MVRAIEQWVLLGDNGTILFHVIHLYSSSNIAGVLTTTLSLPCVCAPAGGLSTIQPGHLTLHFLLPFFMRVLNFIRSLSSTIFWFFFKCKSLLLDVLFAYLCFLARLRFLRIRILNGISEIYVEICFWSPLTVSYSWCLPLH